MKLAATVFLALFLVLDGGLIYGIQKVINIGREGRKSASTLSLLPKGAYLKRAALGYDSLVADILWLKIIQVMGGRYKKATPEQAGWVYNALDLTTDMDPKFEYVYEIGGVFLTVIADNFELSNKILKKGTINNPKSWQPPFFVAVNDFLYLNNIKEAALYMGRAATLPNRPGYLPFLASRLYAEAGNPNFAIELLDNIYSQTKDEKVKASLLERRKELVIEANIRLIEEARDRYKAERRVLPQSVEALVMGGYLKVIPKDPLNGNYSIDQSTGEVRNDKLPRRLKIFTRADK